MSLQRGITCDSVWQHLVLLDLSHGVAVVSQKRVRRQYLVHGCIVPKNNHLKCHLAFWNRITWQYGELMRSAKYKSTRVAFAQTCPSSSSKTGNFTVWIHRQKNRSGVSVSPSWMSYSF